MTKVVSCLLTTKITLLKETQELAVFIEHLLCARDFSGLQK